MEKSELKSEYIGNRIILITQEYNDGWIEWTFKHNFKSS